jgi:hypothetical protein
MWGPSPLVIRSSTLSRLESRRSLEEQTTVGDDRRNFGVTHDFGQSSADRVWSGRMVGRRFDHSYDLNSNSQEFGAPEGAMK